jgi:hypothetical protein
MNRVKSPAEEDEFEAICNEVNGFVAAPEAQERDKREKRMRSSASARNSTSKSQAA